MSSSEEYLDSLLRAIMEGNTNDEPSPPTEQEMTETGNGQETAVLETSDTAMNMDDIEAVFVSTDEETAQEETLAEMPSGDGISSEGFPLDDGILSDELMSDSGMLSAELALDDGMLPEELPLDDGMLSNNLELDDGMLFDEFHFDEGALSDELGSNMAMQADELPISDEALSDELPLDDKILSDELLLDDKILSDDLLLDDSTLSDELALGDETITDSLALNETEMDGLAGEESVEESAETDDLSLEELGLGDLGLEDFSIEEIESGESEAGNDFMLGGELEVGDDFALEDAVGEGDDFTLADIAEEGDDFMLEDAAEGDGSFALEETGDDDADLSALLASMGADDDLSEINDLLEKSDQGVAVDEDIMAMLGDVSGEVDDNSFEFLSLEGNSEDIEEDMSEESTETGDRKSKRQRKKEEKEKKKRDKQAKKVKNKATSRNTNAGEEDSDNFDGLVSSTDEAADKSKKKGAFSRFVDFLLEEDEEEDTGSGSSSGAGGAGLASLTEENKELLAELQAEDKKGAKKKNKKEKKPKKDKGEKAEATPKKPKKEKVKKEKKKKEKTEEEPQVPEKKLSKKKVISVFIFCATIAACIAVVTILLPEQMERRDARVAFDQSQYTQVYELLYGKKLSEDDEVLMQKSSTILKLQRKLDSYENYSKMNRTLEALNALLEGVSRYQILRSDAEMYNVSGEVADIYGQILDALAYNYGLSEADALDIIASGDDITYSKRVQAVISGESFGIDEPVLPEGKQDVLPEEEEIIDRLEGQMEEEGTIDELEEQPEEEEIIDGLDGTETE